MEIKYQLKSASQRRSTPYQPTENIGFGRIRTDHMFVMDYADGQWQNPRVTSFGPLPISPGAMALHYGQSIFEGAKAFLHPNDEIYTFRLDKNIERLNTSASILCMPHVPAEMQKQAIEALIDVERLWFPRQEGACFYIRPFMFATEDNLSVRSANAYTYCVVISPSGAYYPDGNNSAIRLLVSKKYHRAVSGGTGAAKASGNYAASLRAATAAKEFGAAQVLYLDANNQQIEEAGAMNHFHVRKDGTLIIPTFTDTILKSITSQSVLALGEHLGCEIKQETIMIDDFIADVRSGEIVEAGGFGTAAVVSAVGEYIFEDNTIIQVADGQVGPVTKKLYQLYSDIQNGRCDDPYNWLTQIPRLYK
ncbi:branched-chain amino acid aminotransferase [Pseudoalteromonas ulvae UL12]|uniref:Branched-chain-amino-acid aminotransferase n=1 Tax=Pseudoalteromonas ulvae TaxID=107327 RepID=A0A244CMN2_PSEDV|nr:branched-chain amino acid aminotransferase [Pseudoalteromonas ulvae]MBE0363989.1 branched-chain amino acid aminotransferase [Pseudoalteromonas ulvae UL12]OUL56766.1 branched chain amino acid aminotransferase [Pseudoalteromonas ulvae]